MCVSWVKVIGDTCYLLHSDYFLISGMFTTHVGSHWSKTVCFTLGTKYVPLPRV
jgi:hypothetical protein